MKPRDEENFAQAFEEIARMARRSVPTQNDAGRDGLGRARFVAWANRPARRKWTLRLTIGVFATAAVVLFWLRPAAPLRYEIIAASGPAPQPAVLGAGTLVRFSDATELEFGSDGRGWLAETTAVGARVVIDNGSLRARVTPTGKARWTVQAGPFLVKVTGTAFKVDWQRTEGRFSIAMNHGSVVVEGPGFAQRLTAGQTLEATSAAGLVRMGATSDDETADLDAGAPTRAPVADGTPATSRPASWRTTRPQRRPVSKRVALTSPADPVARDRDQPVSWSRRLALGQFGAVVADAEARGIDRVMAQGSVDDLAALATAARLAQRPTIARQALETQRARYFATPAGREATFYLGWLADESDGDRAAAVRWYDRYLADAPDGALADEAMGRKLRALLALGGAGPRNTARATARLYLARFPNGGHAVLARSLTGTE